MAWRCRHALSLLATGLSHVQPQAGLSPEVSLKAEGLKAGGISLKAEGLKAGTTYPCCVRTYILVCVLLRVRMQ